MLNSNLIEKLKSIVGPNGYLENADISPAYHHDISGIRTGMPLIVLRPSNTDEVSQILKLCNDVRQPVIPQGGMTGLVSAGTPVNGEVALSLQRMNRIEDFDDASALMTVQAGTPLQAVQEAADKMEMFFPLDIGSRGSCTIGGNLSTNAGGNRVIRYGMARDLVLGLEVVLADGTIINNLNKMRKNNAGYDFKNLFMGSEGTLGILTRAVLILHPKPTSKQVAFCSLSGFPEAISLLKLLKVELGGRLSAFEALWSDAFDLIINSVPKIRSPIKEKYPLYILIEATGSNTESDQTSFEMALKKAIEKEYIKDVVIAQSLKEIEELWAVRDGISEAVLKLNPFLSYDVSLDIKSMEHFAKDIQEHFKKRWGNANIGIFGHIGDGNIHIVTDVGADGITSRSAVDDLVYGTVRDAKGSISAEHGIGFQKKSWLSYSRSKEEIDLMRTLKSALDPNCILSPGRVI